MAAADDGGGGNTSSMPNTDARMAGFTCSQRSVTSQFVHTNLAVFLL